ncbi:MAG TPA: hypothetical protein PK239_08120 [Chitinophagales bacterium]|nr:hypothetical protein [Chitinophagales bacterium]
MQVAFVIFWLCLVLPSKLILGQETAKNNKWGNWEIGLEGMLGISVGNNFVAVNAGGPAFLVKFHKNLKIGVGALPSFYVLNGKTGARLGVSPRIDFKNIVLIAPFYHRDSTGEWISSVGLGYKFHAKK